MYEIFSRLEQANATFQGAGPHLPDDAEEDAPEPEWAGLLGETRLETICLFDRAILMRAPESKCFYLTTMGQFRMLGTTLEEITGLLTGQVSWEKVEKRDVYGWDKFHEDRRPEYDNWINKDRGP
jgi:hypothetical protein